MPHRKAETQLAALDRPRNAIMSFYQSNTSYGTYYKAIYGSTQLWNSDTEAGITITFPMVIKRTRAIVDLNSNAASASFAFRDDGVDVGALTIPANTTGEFDSGELNWTVAAGSVLNMRYSVNNGAGVVSLGFHVEYQA